MDPKKSNVVKSKSSNSAITSKSDRVKSPKNKKTRSDAEFQPRLHPRFERKRGVYVEKKATKLSINAEGKEPKLSKPPPRPKRNQKRFLASVLTILSKCTTSTQYPDVKEPIKIERLKARKVKKRTVSPLTVQMVERGIQQEELQMTEPNEKIIKHQKYKSRILNEVLYRDKDPLVILKERRDIIQTPSNYSQRSYRDSTDSNRFLNLHNLINYEDKCTKVQRRVSLDSGAKDDTEKKGKKENIFQLNHEPTTLVSENTKKEEKGLYNFFVDLLETTFNVYNVKDGSVTAPLSGECSKVKFEIDETVAKKLEVPKGDSEEEIQKWMCSHDFVKTYNVVDGKIGETNRAASPKPSNIRSPRNRSPKSPRTGSPKSCRSPRTRSPRSCRSPVSKKSRSPPRSYQKMFPINQTFAYTQQFKESPKTQSLIMSKRPVSKRHKKKSFLNSLKEQLRIDDDEYDEPRNLYQALKIIARNKRKCRKSIQFDNCVKFTANDEPDSECWRRRRVISYSGNFTRRNMRFYDDRDLMKSFRTSSIMRTSRSHYFDNTQNTKTCGAKSKSAYTTEPEFDTESCHSIEVQGYDYETSANTRKKLTRLRKINKPLIIPKASNTSLEYDFGSKDAMFKFAESVANSLAYNRANGGVYKSISQIMLGQ